MLPCLQRRLAAAPALQCCLALAIVFASFAPASSAGAAEAGKSLAVLFLGDAGPHRPMERFRQLQPVLAARGIELTYTEDVDSLHRDTLAKYDGLIIYANIERGAPRHVQALLDFVAGGGGFVPIHCASYCFLQSTEYVELVGAQFQRHESGVFRTERVAPDHPILQGFEGFESWDETYVHHRHNEHGRTVLEYRVEGDHREPWTWVRTHGDGRVFYTAWGHDQRTWGHPGFVNLVERGIRWATGNDPTEVPPYAADRPFEPLELAPLPPDDESFDYVDVGKKIPIYPSGERWGTQAESRSKMQLPLPPSKSRERYAVPQGFRLELFAAEPEIGGKPIAMNWDERGRLWIAETLDYPNELQPQGQGRDRLRVLADTNGDGRADRSHVFAERLTIPSTFAFHRGGVIVQDGVETVFLKDTTGDGRADRREVLFTGWDMADTHAGVSNFQYGLDNWIWAVQGYNNSNPVVRGEPQQRFRMGFFRFRPDGSQLEFLRSTNNNTWGLGISEEGLVFASTANRNPSVYLPIPNRYYEMVRGWTPSLVLSSIADSDRIDPITDNVRQMDHHGAYTAGAGHALYTARAYPREWWNRTALVCEPTGHLVGTFVLRPEGSGFRSVNASSLLASDDEWAAPIMAEVGPDGCVWILDWYNFIVQHNPTPQGFETGRGNAYETDLRDKKHGRVYRLVHEDAPDAHPLDLSKASAEMLVETLRHPTMLWRKHAQRLLVERGDRDVVPALEALVRDRSVDEIGLNVGAIHALWTLHGLNVLDGSHAAATEAVVAALRHPSPGVRRNAASVLPPTSDSTAALLASGVLSDAEPHVRLAAFLALADLPATPAAGEALAAALDDPTNATDRWIPDAVTSAAAQNAEEFLTAVAQRDTAPEKLLDVTMLIAEHYARGAPAETAPLLLAQLGDASPQVAEAIVRGLVGGWPEGVGVVLDESLEESLDRAAARLAPATRGSLVKLATRWGSARLARLAAEISEALLDQLADEALPDEKRAAAAREYVEFRAAEAEAVEKLLESLTPRTSPALAVGIVESLGASTAAESGEAIVAGLDRLTPAVRSVAIAVLMRRPAWTASLLEAIDRGELLLSELSLDQKQSLAAHPDEAVRRRARAVLERGGSLPSADRQQVLDELLPLARTTGDAAAGKAVFTKHCATCHTHRGEGRRIGPDLTGMAVHPKEELLVHILDPSRDVEGNYRAYTVVTAAGQVMTGLLAAESKTTVELIDAEGNRRTLLRDDIDELTASGKSLMPEGFEKQVTAKELTNLLEFLTERGRFVPLNLSKVATVSSDRGMFYSRESTVERLVFDEWTPKMFGDVPFLLIDPREGSRPNAVLFYGPQGNYPPKMPRSVELPCNTAAAAIHLLGGVSGWGYPLGTKGSVSLVVRLHYRDGEVEEHPLLNGEHLADYIRRVDVPGSEFAFDLDGRQLRYLAVHPQRSEVIERIEIAKGDDATAPVIMAVTVETLP